ncbi:MAG: hypothetical protein ACAF41_05215 [Leptolyngbya sp. BL-A-14]
MSVQASVSPSPIASVEAKSPEPSPSIDPIRFGEVGLDDIEPKLIAKQGKLNIQFKTQSSQNCRLTMQYPYISGLADTVLQAQLNGRLRQEMMLNMRAPEVMLDGDRCRNVSRKPGETHTETAHCEVHFAEESLVSISCLNFTSPGAYPQPDVNSVTFDLETGKIYQLANLFRPDSKYTVRLAVAMRDAWWETAAGIVDFPFESLENRSSFDFYFQARCDEALPFHWDRDRLKNGPPPKVCMVIPNLGSGASRNWRMAVRLSGIKEILDTSGALKVLVDKID